MCVIWSAAYEGIQAAFFHYAKSRSGDTVAELLSEFRRYYIESIPLDSSGKELPGSKGAEGREFISLLFRTEDRIRDLPYEEKKQKRQEAVRPVLNAFWSWVEKTSALTTTNERLTKAPVYSVNQKKYLETFI